MLSAQGVVATIGTTVSAFVGAVEPEVAVIVQLAGGSQTLQNKISDGLDTLKNSASALAQADRPDQGAAAEVEADVEAVLNVLTTAPVPGNLVPVIRAASMALPMLFSLANFFLPAAKPAA
jgi:hypothetical protein